MSLSVNTLLSLSLALGSVLATPADYLSTRQTTTTPTFNCATGLHLMVAGGKCCQYVADANGPMQDIITNLTATYPGTDEYLIPYANQTAEAKYQTPIMTQNVTDYATACPNTPIVLMGYSLGGIIQMNTVCGNLSPNFTNNVIAVMAYGEETYAAGQSYDYGTCMNNAPSFTRANPSLCATYAPQIFNVCDADDPQCCANGTDQSAHYAYGSRYFNQSLAFIGQKYQAWKVANAPKPTPPSTPKPVPSAAPKPAPQSASFLQSIQNWFKSITSKYQSFRASHP